LESILQWGMDIIVGIQQIRSPVLDSIFSVVTYLGGEQFYLFLVPLILWCVDFGFGARLAFLFLLSSYLNVGLKDAFQQPRPFDLVPGVQVIEPEGFGLPSYHAQSAVVVWGGIANWGRRNWLWVVSIVLTVLVGFSRIYLGVHFLTDVLAGWVIGIVFLVLYLILQPAVTRRLAELRPGIQVILAVAVPTLLLLIHPTKDSTSAMAALAGAGAGLALTYRYFPFSAQGRLWKRVVRFLAGGVVIVGLYVGLKVVLPGEDSSLFLVFRFLHYGVIGLWITLGAPWVFGRLRLVSEGDS
jgi:membrane-associated phospholipid phosphatase